ncbi:dihydrofolate reductase [Clostridiaceae bacterium AF42-6]|nr:dihydrofolate reductase [Clostridiaceae bacterium AF42-6]
MNLIVNVDSNWAIGYRGKLLVSIPEDMKFFRSETTGKVVVLGRKTLDTFPGGQPLKNRTNIILTRNPNYQVKGAIICHSVEKVLEELKKYNSDDVYIIGGDSIYKEFLPYCDVAHVTRTDHVYDADAWFPNLEEDPAWVLTGESEEKTYFDLEFRFCRYERREA